MQHRLSLKAERARGVAGCPGPLMPLQLIFCVLLLPFSIGQAAILWSDLGSTLVHDSGRGADILGGAVSRDDKASDTLYFKVHISPLSDVSTEEYEAAFQLFRGETEGLAIGNSMAAWAWSAYHTAETGVSNKVLGDFDLHSSHPESSGLRVFLSYELPRRGIDRTIVFKVQYVPGADDLVTVWLDPDLSTGMSEGEEPESLTTRFRADASFDQIHLRHNGGGGGWVFSDMAIASSFADLVGASAGRLAENSAAQAYSFRAWQREQGLPQNLVRALLQSRDGYLWVGTDDGVARFDGIRFVPVGWREGLKAGPVGTLYEDRTGALWMGSLGNGLFREANGVFTNFTADQGLPSNFITALYEDGRSNLWAGTSAGLAMFSGNTWKSFTNNAETDGKPVTALFRDTRGGLWAGISGSGVYLITNGTLVRFEDPAVEPLLKDTHSLLVDGKGNLWVGAGDDFLLCREQREWRRFRIPRHLARPFISSLTEAPDGSIWAGSVSEGLFLYRDGKLRAVNASSGLLDNFVDCLLVDREGNLWVGTGAGLNQLRPKAVIAYAQDEGLGYGPVEGLAEVAPGVVWACKGPDGLFRFDGRTFSRIPGGLAGPVHVAAPGSNGDCWLGTGRGMASCKSDGDDLRARNDLPGEDIRAILVSSNRVWAGTREGRLWLKNGDQWQQLTNFPNQSPITALAEDREAGLWIGTAGGGLAYYNGIVRARVRKGKSVGSDYIQCILCDSQGNIWVGTAGAGLAELHNNKWVSFTTREGLPDDTVSQILEDDSERLWLGCNRGIACIRRRDLHALAEQAEGAVHPRVYGRAEGMLSEECTGGFTPAGLKTKGGRLWFSTLKGIVAVDPRPKKTDPPPPIVRLEEVLVDGVAVDFRKNGLGNLKAGSPPGFPAEGPVQEARGVSTGTTDTGEQELRIGPGRHQLEFRYTALSFSAPEQLRFRYRLKGLNEGWTEAGNVRSAPYAYVPPGNYRFEVAAFNADGVASRQPVELALALSPQFWQTRWFIALSGLFLLGSAGGVARVVEKRKLRRHLRQIEQERAVEQERARIARDLHDDLGSSLTRISLLSDLARADKDNPVQVAAHAEKISESAAHTVRALEEIVWAVRPGSDTLQSLVDYIVHFANEMFSGTATHCRLDMPPEVAPQPLAPEVRHNIFLIVKEALTNALKHSGAKEVILAARVEPGAVEFTVADDGSGFTPQEQKGQRNLRNGLNNMRQRAASIGATLGVESGNKKGTTVRLRVPLLPKNGH